MARQEPWIPPKTSLPPDLVQAAEFLLKQGIGDPRGGEYRVAKIIGSDVWVGEQAAIEIRGWVLPEKPGKPRVIVGLNGVRYPVVEVGPPADIDADLTVDPYRLAGPGSRLMTSYHLASVLLLIRGETERAERTFRRGREGADPGERFVNLSTGYLGAMWERAVTTHMAGDAQQALQIGREIATHRDAFEAEGLRLLGEKRVREQYESILTKDGKPLIFRFLYPLDVLIRESQRRVKRGPKVIDWVAIKALPTAERIRALVDALDEVSVRQWGQPGRVELGSDPIVQAIAKEGDAAIPFLLRATESDDRLTRSVGFGRDFFPERSLKTVRTAAATAIQVIFQTFDFSSDRFAFDPAYARALWRRTKGMAPVERWLTILEDDKAGSRKWEEAARSLFRRGDVQMLSASSWRGGAPYGKSQAPYKATSLRASLRPRLTAILVRRTRELAGLAPEKRLEDVFDLRAPLETLRSLALWDKQAARPVGREVLNKAYRFFQQSNQRSSFRHVADPFGEAVDALVKGGDYPAFEAYASFLKQMVDTDGLIWSSDGKVLAPFTNLRKDPRGRAVNRDLFLGEKSAFNLPKMAREWHGRLDPVVTTPLIENEIVQEAILRVLDDETSLGSLVTGPNGMVALYSEQGDMVMSLSVDDSVKPPPTGERISFRVSDSLMTSLTKLKGAPRFIAYAPLEERNKAIADMKRFLRVHAQRMNEVLDENLLLGWGG